MLLHDALTLDAPIRTKDGFMAVRARAARAGVYDYLGREVDPEGKKFTADQVVKVYRPASEVFAQDSVGSFLMKPITDDHPSVPVTADNWKAHARGAVAKALRDGEHLAFDLVLMDRAAINAVDAGKRELSNGYSCDLSFEDGTTPDGQVYQAVQRNIRGNHVALVDRGRAGPECRIADRFAACDANPHALDGVTQEKTVKKITLDGLQVDLSDADAVAAAIEKLQGQIADKATALTAAETQVATLTTDKATLEAKVTTLETQLADAKLTPQQLRDAAKAFQVVADKAKALGVTVSDEMDEAAIMKAAVTAKVGDAAEGWNDAQIAASFATLTKDAKVQDGNVVQPIGQPANMNDAESALADAQSKAADYRRNAWKTPATAANA